MTNPMFGFIKEAAVRACFLCYGISLLFSFSMMIPAVFILSDAGGYDDLHKLPLMYAGWVYALGHIILTIMRAAYTVFMAYLYYERNPASKRSPYDVFGHIFWGDTIPDDEKEEENGGSNQTLR
jgi:hypothetical protein